MIAEDLTAFDYVLAMDHDNLAHLRAIRNQSGGVEPRLLLSYARGAIEEEVPDPYYGGNQGFEHVLDLIEAASEGLLADIRSKHLD